jgi:hypothetical protein
LGSQRKKGKCLPTKLLTEEQVAAVRQLLKSGTTHEVAAVKTGVSLGSVSRIARGIKVGPETATGQARNNPPDMTPIDLGEAEPKGMEEVRKLLQKGARTTAELANAMDCAPRRIEELLMQFQERGGLLFERDGKWDLHHAMHIEPTTHVVPIAAGHRKFGVLGDNHLCNKHSRLDVLRAAYDRFADLGITDVYNTGNYVDGEKFFNKTELLVRPGMQAQSDYAVQEYPQRPGITTHFIDGDDHEGWYYQREGVQFGKLFEADAIKAGRTDLHYLGYGECDIKLTTPQGGEACLKVVHPGGGSAYATSYALQKLVESYQGGEKPQIIFAGHYHKYESGYPREIHVLQTACTCDQTMFLRKNKIGVHVGFCVVDFDQEEDGSIHRFTVEWNPFYDRKRYETRFGR